MARLFFRLAGWLWLAGASFLPTACARYDAQAGAYGLLLLAAGRTVPSYMISISVSGYSGGAGFVVTNQSTGESISPTANGSFAFSTLTAQGSPYNVQVTGQPTSQNCTVSAGNGIMGGAAIILAVNCGPGFTIGGTVSGYTASTGALVLKETNSGQTTSLSANGAYSFPTTWANAASYTVTVQTQPTNPWQNCTVSNPSGTISGANVTNVNPTCSLLSFNVIADITGLGGATGLVLTNSSNGNTVSGMSTDGSYTFSTAVTSGSAYNIQVTTQPTGKTCFVSSGSGTMAGGNVNVSVNCSTNPTIGGSISGFSAGTNLVLKENVSGQTATLAAGATSFTFASAVAVGSSYNVTVQTQPTNPWLTCTPGSNTGTANADVTTVTITCVPNTYTVGVSITGLTGTGIVFTNLTDSQTLSGITADGTYTFASALNSGSNYNVSITTQPSGQSCSVTSPSGTVANANVTLTVTCGYTIGGTITGYTGSGLILAESVSSQTVTVTSGSTSYTFAAAVANSASYNVTVNTQPSSPAQLCTVANGSGTISSASVTNVNITCSTPKRLFITATTTSGNAGGISGADSICNADANKPNASTYRAVIVDGTNRQACSSGNCSGGASENINWALLPNQVYTRANGTTIILTTDASGIFTFGTLTNTIGTGSTTYWTGLNTNWTTGSTGSSKLCDNSASPWQDGGGGGNRGQRGSENQTSSSAISSGNTVCSSSLNLLCAEQ